MHRILLSIITAIALFGLMADANAEGHSRYHFTIDASALSPDIQKNVVLLSNVAKGYNSDERLDDKSFYLESSPGAYLLGYEEEKIKIGTNSSNYCSATIKVKGRWGFGQEPNIESVDCSQGTYVPFASNIIIEKVSGDNTNTWSKENKAYEYKLRVIPRTESAVG